MAGKVNEEEDKKTGTQGTGSVTDDTNGGTGNGSTGNAGAGKGTTDNTGNGGNSGEGGNGKTDTTDTTVDEDLKAITDPYDASIGDTQDMIKTLTGSKNQYEEDTKTINKQNKKASMWSGIAEAAAGLVNLFGTMGGATAMKWESPQAKWQDRIHTIAKERESKLEKYNSQLNELNKQLNQLQRKKSDVVAQYKKNEAKIAAHTDEVIKKAISSYNETLAKLDASKKTAIAKSAVSLFKQKASDYFNTYGYFASEEKEQEWAKKCLELAMTFEGEDAEKKPGALAESSLENK